MTYIQTDTYRIRSAELDANGRLSVPALMNMMQESANRNALDYGIGIADLAQQGFGWMLMRLRISLYQYPLYDQSIRMITYPTAVDKYFIYRDFNVLAEDGTRLADASSTWLTFSMERRTMVPLPEFIRRITLPTNIDPQLKLSPKPDFLPPDGEPAKSIDVGWFDIDQNQHTNNVAYVQWLLETVDDAALQLKQLSELDVFFRTESHWHDRLQIRSRPESSESWLHGIRHATTGKDVLLARSRWRDSL